MKRLFTIAMLILMMMIAHPVKAGDLFEENHHANSLLTPSKMTRLSVEYFNPLGAESLQDTTALTREQQLAQLPGYKLPKKALFFSAVIPGAGELYVKSYLKAAAFFLIEVGAWTYYGVYQKKGKEQEDKYENFANAHWDSTKWRFWYDGLTDNQKNSFTHAGHMLELIRESRTTQQYYEMIGKYYEFYIGWDEVDDPNQFDLEELFGEHRASQIVDDYMSMRAKSNDFFAQARNGTTIAMINHLLSAVDAAWTAKIKNNRLLKTALKMEQIQFDDRVEPVLSLKFKW